MNIGIVGAGHSVSIANSRGPDSPRGNIVIDTPSSDSGATAKSTSAT